MRLRIALTVIIALIPLTAAAADPDSGPPAEHKILNSRTAAAAPVPVPAVPSGISTDKVLVIGLDGLRHDRIAPADAPNLDALISGGTLGTSLLYTNPMAATSSGPGWSTIATGVWPDRHKVKDNSFTGKRYDLYPDFLTRIEGVNPAYSTYAAVDWKPLGEQGTFGAGIDARVVLDGDSAGYPAEDERITQVSEQVLRDRNPDIAFVYLGQIDIAGHNSGAGSQAYLNAVKANDAQIGRLLSAVRARPTYASERWTVVVATDHGHTGIGGHGGSTIEERRTFVLASGPGIPAGARPADTRLVDVAATVFARLGLPRPAGLDGTSVTVRSADPFETVALSPRVHETGIPAGVTGFTHLPPAGWAVDSTALPSGGVEEWRGWSFTTDEFWSRAERDQWRELFVRGRGVFAVADSDEWDDRSHGAGTYASSLISPAYDVAGRTSAVINYTTLYRPEGNQKAHVQVSFDGGAFTTVKAYGSEAVSTVEALAVTVPPGATTMAVRFRYFDAANNWYWAVDDVRVS
ncbi:MULTISPECIES: alkaline phosphatase family protein [Streptosporangium]|uniref:Nucleotide pyrophosphatase n=1 Tax=Streptosporangium brasiliense TaxID=47480 RepID=A0ABT9RJU6_9ACTN|nr:alkaline phosphatase family protein [Streptosporangium brasiliense]MDP9869574.1 hypothetical protein [Streptosporangium brasiliense]